MGYGWIFQFSSSVQKVECAPTFFLLQKNAFAINLIVLHGTADEWKEEEEEGNGCTNCRRILSIRKKRRRKNHIPIIWYYLCIDEPVMVAFVAKVWLIQFYDSTAYVHRCARRKPTPVRVYLFRLSFCSILYRFWFNLCSFGRQL